MRFIVVYLIHMHSYVPISHLTNQSKAFYGVLLNDAIENKMEGAHLEHNYLQSFCLIHIQEYIYRLFSISYPLFRKRKILYRVKLCYV